MGGSSEATELAEMLLTRKEANSVENEKPHDSTGKDLQRRDFLRIAGAVAAGHFLVLNGAGGKAWATSGGDCTGNPFNPPDVCDASGLTQMDVCEPHVGNPDHCGETGPGGLVPDTCNPSGMGPGPQAPDVCGAPATSPDNCELSLGDPDECAPVDVLEGPDVDECQFPMTSPDLCLVSEPDTCNTREPIDIDHCGQDLGEGYVAADKCNTAYFDEDKCGQTGALGVISDSCEPVLNDPDLCDVAFGPGDQCDPMLGPPDSCNEQNGNTDHCGEDPGSGVIVPDSCTPIHGDPDHCGQKNAAGGPIEDNCNLAPPNRDPDRCNLEFQDPDFCTTVTSDACEEGPPGGGNTDHCGQKLEDGVTVATDYCEPLQSNPDHCGYANAYGVPIPDQCELPPGGTDPDMCDQAFAGPDACDGFGGPAPDVCDQYAGNTDHCGEWVNGAPVSDTCSGIPLQDPDRPDQPAVSDADIY